MNAGWVRLPSGEAPVIVALHHARTVYLADSSIIHLRAGASLHRFKWRDLSVPGSTVATGVGLAFGLDHRQP